MPIKAQETAGINVHLHQSALQFSSRIRKMGRSLGASGLFDRVLFVGADRQFRPEKEESPGFFSIHYERESTRTTGLIKKIRRTLGWSRIAREQLSKSPIAIVSCHSAPLLPISFQISSATGAKVVYEPHELESEAFASKGLRASMTRNMEGRFIRKCAAVNVVSEQIAEWYRAQFDIPKPAVIRNIPDVKMATSGEQVDLKSLLGIPSESVLFLYLGGLVKGRRIEQLVATFRRAQPDRHILFLGYGELEQLVKEESKRQGNIHFMEAVPPEEVLRYAQGADVGWCGIENVCLSYYYSLPNKFFEYMLAGLPQVTPDWPEIGPIIKEFSAGWLHGESTEDMVRLVDSVKWSEIEQFAAGARRARECFSWKEEEDKLISVYRKILAG